MQMAFIAGVLLSSVADPNFELWRGGGGGGGRLVLLALSAFPPSLISSFFTQNKPLPPRAIVLLIKPFVLNVPIAVVVFLNSLLPGYKTDRVRFVIKLIHTDANFLNLSQS